MRIDCTVRRLYRIFDGMSRLMVLLRTIFITLKHTIPVDLLEFLIKGSRQFNLTTNDINNMDISIDHMEYKRETSKRNSNDMRDTYFVTIRMEKLEPYETPNQWRDTPPSKNNLIDIKDQIVNSYNKF